MERKHLDSLSSTFDEKLTSGSNISYWIDSISPLKFEPLNENIEIEVVVIGAGISGITTAYCLAKSGKKVVVLEDGYIGSGETGRTTAHIVNALDDRYSEIERYHGLEGSKQAADSHTAAIAFIESISIEENIDCDFKRLNGYLFLHPTDKQKTLEDEFEATHRAGIHTELIIGVPGIPVEEGLCLKFPHQATFHPMKYLSGLANAFIRLGGKVYTETHAQEIKEGEVIANGFNITAKDIVVATNTPINDMFTMHTKQYPYRTYVIASIIPKGSVDNALWWDTGDQHSKCFNIPYNYVRLQEYDEQYDLIICGGADHKTGQADKENLSAEDRYRILEDWMRQRFTNVLETVYRWSGQVMDPVDSLGYIGKNPGDKNIYIVTGDSGNGMTHGTIAGILLDDLINGRENPWEKLYDPSRITLKASKDFISENINVAAQYGDFLSKSDIQNTQELKLDEGAIINSGLKKVAVFKDKDGQIHAYSAICPHLGCVLQWNGEEKSFDCPCHGSRFTCEGKVVNGPALSDLEEVQLKEDSSLKKRA